MNLALSALKSLLHAHPAHGLALNLPDGRAVPAHFHVTEVGHITKKFVDCGGTFRSNETCLLQVYIGSRHDDGHRLAAGKLAQILGLAAPILAGDPPVVVEYEDAVISQYPVASVEERDGVLVLQLGSNHTDCLAKEKCGIDQECGCDAEPAEAAGCCVAGQPGRCC